MAGRLTSRSLLIAVIITMIGAHTAPAATWKVGWSTTASDSYFNGLACTPTNDCLAVGWRTAGGGKIVNTVLRSADGGRSWRRLPTTLPRAGVVLGLSCPGRELCVLTMRVDRRDGPSRGVLARSVDFGSTWTAPTLPGPAASTFDAVSCPSLARCYAAGARDGVGGTAMAASLDGGVSWRFPYVSVSADLLALDCVSEADCVAVGTRLPTGTHPRISFPATAFTLGADQEARARPLPAGTRDLDDVSCRDASLCLAAGGGRLLRSVDAGVSWSRVAPSRTAKQIGDVACARGGGCVAGTLGNPLRLLGSSDGGDSWTVERALPKTTMSRIACAPDGGCVAVTHRGRATKLLYRAAT